MVLSSSLSPNKRPLLFLGTFIHCKTRHHLQCLQNAAVAVDSQGKIAGIKHGPCNVHVAKQQLLDCLGWDEDEVDVCVSKPGQFFFPGFIDTHVHASQYPIVGIFGESTLLDWLQTYVFPAEKKLADCEAARTIYTACVRRTLSHGTTTAAYYTTVHVPATKLLANLCLALGQRAFIGRVCMDKADICPPCLCDRTSDESLEKTREVISHIKEIDPNYEMVSPILTPRFALACSAQAMAGLAKIHEEEKLPVQTHISENATEIKDTAKLFPAAGSYANVYDQYGLLTSRTILGHGVHLTEGEARLIQKRAAKVAHCPCSNSALGSGEARVRWLWERGIDVGLGTDMSGGYSASVLEAARQAALVSRHLAMGLPDCEAKKSKLSVAQVLYLATRGGAKVVGLEDAIGGFDVGKDWDAQLVGLHVVADGQDGVEGVEESTARFRDPGNVDLFGSETWDDMIAKWLYSGDDRNTKKVWVKGRLVHSRP